MKKTGEKLRILMDKKGVTPYEISINTGVSESTLSRVLTKNTKMSISTKQSLAKYFQVNEDYFNESDESILQENEIFDPKKIADYVINNTEQLLGDKNFKLWYENVKLKAQIEAMKNFKQSLD